MGTKKAIKRIFLTIGAASALVASFGVHSALAATLSFSPQSGIYLAGRSFSVSVVVSSPNEAMNAVQGEVSFPTSELEVLSVSEANSIINLWVQNPTFSNQNGTINFGGVAVNPGYEGSSGNIITIQFEAKNSGSAPLSFISGSVLANDGKGTNILTSMEGADFTVTPLSSASAPGSAGAGGIAINSTPAVASGTWYSINSITFNWSIPANADGVDYAISNNPNLQLPDVNQGLVSQTTYDLSSFEDGRWYFFVSFNSGSAWSPPTVMEIMLDRTPPEPFVITREDTNLADPQPVFAWAANDDTSGIDHYEVKIGNGDWFDASTIQNGSSSYMLPPQSPTNSRTLTVRAYDKAGNFTDATTDFTVLPPAVPCEAGAFPCAVSAFFARWGALISLIFILLVIVLYGFLYYLLKWRRQSRKDLQKFKDELQQDLKRVEEGMHRTGTGGKADLRSASFLEQKESLENELRHITEEVKEELKHLKENK